MWQLPSKGKFLKLSREREQDFMGQPTSKGTFGKLPVCEYMCNTNKGVLVFCAESF